MKVTYNGEYPLEQVNEGGDPFIVHHGYTFVRGKSVDVKEEALQAKFAQNRFFETVKSDKDDVNAAKDEAEEAEVQTLRDYLKAENVPAHHRLGLTALRDLKAKHEDAKAKAQG